MSYLSTSAEVVKKIRLVYVFEGLQLLARQLSREHKLEMFGCKQRSGDVTLQ